MESTGFSWSEDREWLVTNGLGGYASSTLTGLNTSKYHGLLVAAFSPEDRRVLLSKIDEEVRIGEDTYSLSANQYCDTVEPDGFKYLKDFSQNPSPTFSYEVPGARIAKSVFMPRGENAIVISYDIKLDNSTKKLDFAANFLTTSRDHNWVLDEPWWDFDFKSSGGIVTLTPGHENPPMICIGSTAGALVKPECGDNRLRGLYYRKDDECGQPCVDDLFIGACLEVSLKASRKFYVVCAADLSSAAESICRKLLEAPFIYDDNERHRKEALMKKYCESNHVTPFKGLDELVASSEDFLVRKGASTAVIAGYPWFGEWGRDSLISLPGLCLTTGKKAEAEGILTDLLAASEKGLIPNNFTGGKSFNSLDASLWLFWVVWKYLEYTKDYGFVENGLWKRMKAVAQAYASMADSDGLIKSSSEKPMTWMDAIVDGKPVTLRRGKAVEIQALWYNALCVLAKLAKQFGEKPDSYDMAARKCKKSFNEAFWNNGKGYLFDYIDGAHKDLAIRPNALFAVSLAFPVLEESKWKSVVGVAERELLTPYGLRTLALSEPGYRSVAGGSQRDRDLSYHQGDIWPWLLGAFTDAYKRAHPHKDVGHFVKPLIVGENHMAVGKIPELYDGSAPHLPGGCIAQAWSVAELMRIIAENQAQV